MPHPETQIPMARPHPTPQKHDSPNANPNGTAQQSADLTKRCACAATWGAALFKIFVPERHGVEHQLLEILQTINV